MKIPKEKLVELIMQREHGDIQAIHDETKLSKYKIRNILDFGRGSVDDINTITKFYKNREDREKSQLV